MIGSSSVSKNCPVDNEYMNVGDNKQALPHMNHERPLLYSNEALLFPSRKRNDGQLFVASTIGPFDGHANTTVPEANADAPLTYGIDVKKMSSICDTKHPSPVLEQPLIVDKAVLVNESPPEPRHMQTNEGVCEDVVAMVDIRKLIAESQYPSSAPQELAKASELYAPRSALSRRRSETIASECTEELVKKISFGTKNAPPNKDCAPPEDHLQPLKKQYCLSLTDDDGNGSRNMPQQEDYEFFRTRSSMSEVRLSRLQSRQEQEQQKEKILGSADGKRNSSISEGSVSAGRYFDALRGPELEFLKDSEELLLPLDRRWPFLLRFPVVSFGIALGLATQAILWKLLAISPSMAFLHVPLTVNFVFWCLALFALVVILSIYALKCLLYFEAVRREFHHPVRVNFFFAPWMGCMLIAISIPPSITSSVHPFFWCVFVTPLLILELKIYGQWLSGGTRRLSKVANASTHVSLVANFVSASLAAQVGWIEPAMFCWAVGCAHYLVLFVTLYQRLPTAEALPKELHPVFFLFVAAPSSASVAWKYIAGEFDRVSKLVYFIALFLFASLVVRVKFFCGFRFSIAWWAYTFPMTALASATVHYSVQVRHHLTQVLAVTLSVVATLTVVMVFICTILHIMWGSLFPNDIGIAITNQRHKKKHKGGTHIEKT